jgi:serine/threonine-protein kinase
MGVVYEVEHARTGERLAFKVLHDRALNDATAVERFQQEARISSRIRSPHVVRVIDAGAALELNNAPYLVMDLLDGSDLARACGDVAQPAARVLEWLRQVAWALDKAHEVGIVHRDLKLENLFLTHDDEGRPLVKVLDFGLAKLTTEVGPGTVSGQILGTPLFMAPEQAEIGAGTVTPRADLFALGLIAHRLLTGRHYWMTRTLVQLAREICFHPMPPPSERGSTLGPAYDAWFARACHRDPSHRFARASDQVEALARALDPTPVAAVDAQEPSETASTTAVDVVRPSPSGRRRWRRQRGIAAAVGLVLALSASLVVAVRGARGFFATAAAPEALGLRSPASSASQAASGAPETTFVGLDAASVAPKSPPLADTPDAGALSVTTTRIPTANPLRSPPGGAAAPPARSARSVRPAPDPFGDQK